MTCAEFESVLADYLDAALPPKERAAIEEHTASCADCRQFMSDVSGGLVLLESAQEVEAPEHLITRIAYLAPQGRTRDPFERQSAVGRLISRWLMPILQPRLAMGMAMTILSFAMLKRCTGVGVQQIQPSDLNPVRVWGGVEDKSMRVKDQIVKYYENLRIVYEIETHMKDIEAAQNREPRSQAQTQGRDSTNRQKSGNGEASGQTPKGKQP